MYRVASSKAQAIAHFEDNSDGSCEMRSHFALDRPFADCFPVGSLSYLHVRKSYEKA